MAVLHTIAEAYVHNLDPYAIQFTDHFGIRWYGLSYVAGLAIAWLMLRWFARTGRSPLTVPGAADVIFAALLGVVIGGRLGFVFFYDLPRALAGGAVPLLWDFSAQLPFWGVLRITDGGMSAHGGILGVTIAAVIFGYRRRIAPLHLLDMGALATCPGLFLGRLANFVNGELWGRALPQSMRADPPWWSIKYPGQISERWLRIVYDPGEIRPSTWRRYAEDFAIDPAGLSVEQLQQAVTDQAAARLNALEPLRDVLPLTEHFHRRVIEAAYDGNQTVIEHLQPLLTPYYPSQILQAITDGPILFTLLALCWLKPRKPGVIGAWFAILYGVLRISTEVFRQPDEGVAVLAGLTRGQLLSVMLVVGGAILLWFCSRRDLPKLGGLLEKPSTAALASRNSTQGR